MQKCPSLVVVWLATAVMGLSSCAVMDKDVPGWNELQHSTHNTALESGIELHFSASGNGSPVLLIHGFGASSYSWRFLVPVLSESHKVITLDLKGAGESPAPKDDQYSVYEQARLVSEFIIKNDLQDVQIVGHSYGGAVAIGASIYLGQSHPELQKSLVLIDSMAYPQKLPYFINILATPLLGPAVITLAPDKMQVKQLLELVYYNDSLVPQAAINHYAEMLAQPNAKYALLKTARQILPPDLDEFSMEYSSLVMPALIIWSRDDEIIPLEIGLRLHEDLPNSQMVLFDHVGHAIQEEAPELVIQMLIDFLSNPQGPEG